jgi:hypothetical protein
MDKTQAIDRSLVFRQGAERYVLLSLVSFAFSVITIRLFLQLTGYPQLGTATLHIAHVLWGGLLLFIAGLLPLVLANAWAYTTSAVLNGIGIGMFIDEVGKFITQTNDYFFPPAAPIIYAFFLITVLLYLYVRRSTPRSPRQVMYQALHDLGEVLDHDLEPFEKDRLAARLQDILQRAPGTNLGQLAQALLQFLETESLYISHRLPTNYERFTRWLRQLEDRARHSWLTERRFRIILALLLALSAGITLLGLGVLLGVIFLQGDLTAYLFEILSSNLAPTPGFLQAALIRLILEGGLSLLLLVAAFLFLRGRPIQAVRLAVLSLVMSLTTVDLLIFYLDQFSAILTVLEQFGLLLLVLLYRQLHLKNPPAPSDGAGPAI